MNNILIFFLFVNIKIILNFGINYIKNFIDDWISYNFFYKIFFLSKICVCEFFYYILCVYLEFV